MRFKVMLLLGFLILILVGILVLQQLTKSSEEVSTPTVRATPTPIAVQGGGAIKITSISPSETFLDVNEAVKVSFSIRLTQAPEVKMEPEAVFKTRVEDGNLVIEPEDAWGFNTSYTLTIPKDSVSIGGRMLEKDYVYNFKTPAYGGM